MNEKRFSVGPTTNVNQFFSKSENLSARYASWDHCYIYFRTAHAEGRLSNLSDGKMLQTSCMFLGFYLASWGMYRNSELQRRNAYALAPVIQEIVAAPSEVWALDVENYDEESIKSILKTAEMIRKALPGYATDTLVSKTMLGTFGNVPAFDTYFRKGFGINRFNAESLKEIKRYFDQHQKEFQSLRRQTKDFEGKPTDLKYTQAKLIDMVFFVEGGGIRDI